MEIQTSPHLKTLETLVSEHPFWSGLPPRFFHLLNEAAFVMRYKPGDFIFQEGQDAKHFYLVQRGMVALETFVPGRGTVTVQTIGAGDALGWSWLFPPHRWHFSARAAEASEIIAFDASKLRAKMDENRDFSNELVMRVAHILLQRLQATRRQLLEFYAAKAS